MIAPKLIIVIFLEKLRNCYKNIFLLILAYSVHMKQGNFIFMLSGNRFL